MKIYRFQSVNIMKKIVSVASKKCPIESRLQLNSLVATNMIFS